MAKKIRVNISLDPSTHERLQQYARDTHTTVSGAITQWIWSKKVSNPQIKGQMSITDTDCTIK